MKLIYFKKAVRRVEDGATDFHGACRTELEADHLIEVETVPNFDVDDHVRDDMGRTGRFVSYCDENPVLGWVQFGFEKEALPLRDLVIEHKAFSVEAGRLHKMNLELIGGVL